MYITLDQLKIINGVLAGLITQQSGGKIPKGLFEVYSKQTGMEIKAFITADRKYGIAFFPSPFSDFSVNVIIEDALEKPSNQEVA